MSHDVPCLETRAGFPAAVACSKSLGKAFDATFGLVWATLALGLAAVGVVVAWPVLGKNGASSSSYPRKTSVEHRHPNLLSVPYR